MNWSGWMAEQRAMRARYREEVAREAEEARAEGYAGLRAALTLPARAPASRLVKWGDAA